MIAFDGISFSSACAGPRSPYFRKEKYRALFRQREPVRRFTFRFRVRLVVKALTRFLGLAHCALAVCLPAPMSCVGRLIWNRQRFFKDPHTGKRIARANPAGEHVITPVPELRMIPDDLWTRVKERQTRLRRDLLHAAGEIRPERARHPSYLLSGLLKCGRCGGGFSKISQEHYGCSNARNRGNCDNRLTIRRDVLEASVLSGVKANLMRADLVKEFIAEYHRELNRAAAERDQKRQRFVRDLAAPNEKSARLLMQLNPEFARQQWRVNINLLNLARKNWNRSSPPNASHRSDSTQISPKSIAAKLSACRKP